MKIQKKNGGRGSGRGEASWGGGVRVDVNGEVFVKIKKKWGGGRVGSGGGGSGGGGGGGGGKV